MQHMRNIRAISFLRQMIMDFGATFMTYAIRCRIPSGARIRLTGKISIPKNRFLPENGATMKDPARPCAGRERLL